MIDTAAILSHLTNTVPPFHFLPQIAAAITIGNISFTVM